MSECTPTIARSFSLACGPWRRLRSALSTSSSSLGTSLEEVADEVAQAVRENLAKAVVDSTNNSAFVGMLAARLPQPAVNHLVAAAITGAFHACRPAEGDVDRDRRRAGALSSDGPSPSPNSSRRSPPRLAAIQCASPAWATGRCWQAISRAMERTVRASGSAFYSAPPGKHDGRRDGVESHRFRVQTLRTARAPTPPRQSAC